MGRWHRHKPTLLASCLTPLSVRGDRGTVRVENRRYSLTTTLIEDNLAQWQRQGARAPPPPPNFAIFLL